MFPFFTRSRKTDVDTWLLAGLGNPGDKYAKNRHNIGFMVVDEIARAHRFPAFRSKFQSQMSEGTIDGVKVILLKPQTYMNLSGQGVAAAAKFYKIPAARIVALHDELDLAPSKIRVKTGGGNAGHNGLKSMQACLGTPDFVRVRLGIGHPGDKDRVSGYVLSDFAKAENTWLSALVDSTAEYIEFLLRGQESDFMSKVAARVNDVTKTA